MRLGKISLAAFAAASLISAPAMASSLSPTAKVVGASKMKAKRVGAFAKGENKADSGTIIAVAAGAAVILAIVLISDGDNKRRTSP